MEKEINATKFILLGLIQSPEFRKIFFVIFLIIYIITIKGNILIVITIIASQTLRSPMYFILTFFSIVDGTYSSVVASEILVDLIYEKSIISLEGCLTPLFASHFFFFGGVGIIFLMIMAYDRYVAICKHLHYMTIMNPLVCHLLLAAAWIRTSILLIFMAQIPYCVPNFSNTFMCDLFPFLKLACMDTQVPGIIIIANSGVMCLSIFLVLTVSYGVILCSLKGGSSEGTISSWYKGKPFLIMSNFEWARYYLRTCFVSLDFNAFL